MSEGKCAGSREGKKIEAEREGHWERGGNPFPLSAADFKTVVLRAWIEQPSSNGWIRGKMAPQDQKVSPVSEKLPARNGVTCKLVEESSAVAL